MSKQATHTREFETLFRAGERNTLLGRKRTNLLFLTGIFAATFLAIGFAGGSLRYLEEKMRNPFVNWVSIDVPFERTNDVDKVVEQLTDPEAQKQFGHESVSSYIKAGLPFWRADKQRVNYMRGRSVIDDSDPLVPELLKPTNRVRGDSTFSQGEIGLIVSEDFLQELGYPLSTPVVYFALAITDSTKPAGSLENRFQQVPLPIRAVVRTLPGKALFIYSKFLYRTWVLERFRFDVRPYQQQPLLLACASSDRAGELLTAVDQLVNANFAKAKPEVYETSTIFSAGNVKITVPDSLNADSVYRVLRASLLRAGAIPGFTPEKDFFICYNYDLPVIKTSGVSTDAISVYFTRLDSVRSFADHYYKTLNDASDAGDDRQSYIEIDVEKVIEKQNFNFMYNLNQIVALMLVVLGGIGVTLFVSNLLRGHFERIKMNLGTFLAFGVGEQSLIRIYIRITLEVVVLSLTGGLLAASVMGLGVDWLMHLAGKAEKGVSYYQYFGWWHLITAVILLVFSAVIAARLTRTLLLKTPGDLIYNR